ncbi:hypothetical protein KW797_03730, partial [Candidatus Parcubacteria bacterium]|nr:hypothetical protein [Candidatus Parcubacteria bacterium]
MSLAIALATYLSLMGIASAKTMRDTGEMLPWLGVVAGVVATYLIYLYAQRYLQLRWSAMQKSLAARRFASAKLR